ncbi:glycosyltransferase [Desulfoplanes formicivorans]|uniref:Glycosyl transferase n=1 Tax=Desulfoplanes formicivorans TaxID=1592317 RepID=A0A194AI78_9BACT|nr:glycosyltransferase [Desulfoplanes formicivorans]GAU09787.1 glycosyl transferase [Desulfoplanes formicivorans]
MDQTLFLHSLLDYQGGAARISWLLKTYCRQQGREVCKSCEIPDGLDATSRVVLPEALGREAQDGLLHVHSTGSWPLLLTSLKRQGIRPVITLHDARLLTGGCFSPGGCQQWRQGCPGICPQGVARCNAWARTMRSLLEDINPILVAPSRWMATMARTVFPGLKIVVVPNGVPWTPARPVGCGAERVPNAPVVLFVAHGGEKARLKGGASWKPLWERIKARVPACKGFFVGGERSGRHGDVTLLPYLAPDLLASLMAGCSVLVYPTLADNHPLLVLEAMAQKLPCVAFAVGGIPEQIVHQETGVLVSPGDEDALVEQVTELLMQPARCRRMGERAFETGKKRFALERMGAGYERVYARMRST